MCLGNLPSLERCLSSELVSECQATVRLLASQSTNAAGLQTWSRLGDSSDIACGLLSFGSDAKDSRFALIYSYLQATASPGVAEIPH